MIPGRTVSDVSRKTHPILTGGYRRRIPLFEPRKNGIEFSPDVAAQSRECSLGTPWEPMTNSSLFTARPNR